MRWHIRRDAFALSIIVAMCVLSLVFYPRLPESIPSHFAADGTPDTFSPKLELMLILIGTVIGFYMLLTVLPLLDPLWKKISTRYHILLLFRDFLLAFLLFLYCLSIVAAFEGNLRVHLLGVGFGLLFIVFGNYLPKLPRNWFFGIRVPWTLSSDTVWRKTHVLGGWMFVLAGLCLAALSLLKVNLLIAFLATLGPTVLVTGFLYPFLLFRRLQKEGDASG